MKGKREELVTRYRGLSPAAKGALWVLIVLELVLIVAAQRDIQRRPADRIRGPKLLWRLVATINFLGPAAYFGIGRRRGERAADSSATSSAPDQ